MADGVEKKTYSAKQVATRIGTDAKQLRKFFRDPKSTYNPVGQGGRYDFPEAEIPKIKLAFDEWNATKVRRNRATTAERNPTSAAGLIPGQRKQSPGTDTPPRPRRRSPEALFKQGLHGNALDDDTFSQRTKGIGARVQRHGLIPNQQGRLVEKPDHIRKAEEAKKSTIMSNREVLDHDEWEKAQPAELDFSESAFNDLLKGLSSAQEDPDAPGMELELEDDGDLVDEEIDFDDEDVEQI